jgi:hypothetical protein
MMGECNFPQAVTETTERIGSFRTPPGTTGPGPSELGLFVFSIFLVNCPRPPQEKRGVDVRKRQSYPMRSLINPVSQDTPRIISKCTDNYFTHGKPTQEYPLLTQRVIWTRRKFALSYVNLENPIFHVRPGIQLVGQITDRFWI